MSRVTIAAMLGTHMADWQRGYEINSFFTKDSTQTYRGQREATPPSHRRSQLLDQYPYPIHEGNQNEDTRGMQAEEHQVLANRTLHHG